ncbi:hypothetical protein Tco_0716323 [Tanacetum coccineum]
MRDVKAKRSCYKDRMNAFEFAPEYWFRVESLKLEYEHMAMKYDELIDGSLQPSSVLVSNKDYSDIKAT